MIDFSKAYTAQWKVVEVNVDTWDDGDVVDGVNSIVINRDATDSVPLLETATFNIDTDVNYTLSEGWYRVILICIQDSIYERYPISTVMLQKSDDTIRYGRATSSVSGSSVLKPLEERKNVGTDYRYVPKGVNGAQWVTDLINSVTPAPAVMSENGFTLDSDVVFSPGISYLEMVWNVLDKAKWCMIIDGEGTIEVLKKPTEPTVYLNGQTKSLLVPGIKRTLSYKDVCNRYYAIDKDGTREIAENHNPTSPLSYESRGRWVDYVDTSPSKVNGETLYAYARRRLEEESTLVQTYSYFREYWPGVYPFSMISATLSPEGIEGDLRVMSQTINCDKGVRVSETAGLEIKEWTR